MNIVPKEKTGWDISDRVSVPLMQLPRFKTGYAIEQGTERNIIFVTWGGLGDQICAEPTLRYALETFKGCSVSLASEHPELFQHLSFTDVFDLRRERPVWEKYLRLDTIVEAEGETNLVWQFMGHLNTHCVDFPSLCALAMQLPIKSREITLKPSDADHMAVARFRNSIVLHPGKHWQSKTFPVDWWNAVINQIIGAGLVPVIIGAVTDDNRGTVDIDTAYCIDLRDKLSVMQSVALLQQASVLLTNDSAPMHMAASGDAWIGYIATCKHPDFISHWRHGQWSWRMENHGKGGIWDVIDFCPNKAQTVEVENVGEENLRAWLPDPKDFANWAIEKDGVVAKC